MMPRWRRRHHRLFAWQCARFAGSVCESVGVRIESGESLPAQLGRQKPLPEASGYDEMRPVIPSDGNLPGPRMAGVTVPSCDLLQARVGT